MLIAVKKDIGEFIEPKVCGLASATAGGTGDNTAVEGQTIDRLGYNSVKVIATWKAVLAEAKTLSIAAEYEQSSDGSTWDTAVALQTSTVVDTGGTGGSTEYDETSWDLDLSDKKRYIRFNFTPNLSATGTDTCLAALTAALGGADRIS